MNTDGLTKTSLSSNFTIKFLSQGSLMLGYVGQGQFCILFQFSISGMDGIVRLTQQIAAEVHRVVDP